MRHLKAGRHLSRTSAHRKAMFSNMVESLILNERVRTTDAKAKELRRLAERTIAWGLRVGDLVAKDEAQRSPGERAEIVHAVRMVKRTLTSAKRHEDKPDAVHKIFHDLAPRYRGRQGGYTRVLKIGRRLGDAAPESLVELLPAEGAKEASTSKGKAEKR